MTAELDELLDNDTLPKPRRAKKRKVQGPLHNVLTRALPDMVDAENGMCNLHTLAKALGLSPQGVYKWMKPNRPNRLPKSQIEKIVKLSEKQTTAGIEFVPATANDFWEFLSP